MTATKTVLTSLIVGTAIGLALGFLYVPRNGKETREMIVRRVKAPKQNLYELVTTA